MCTPRELRMFQLSRLTNSTPLTTEVATPHSDYCVSVSYWLSRTLIHPLRIIQCISQYLIYSKKTHACRRASARGKRRFSRNRCLDNANDREARGGYPPVCPSICPNTSPKVCFTRTIKHTRPRSVCARTHACSTCKRAVDVRTLVDPTRLIGRSIEVLCNS